MKPRTHTRSKAPALRQFATAIVGAGCVALLAACGNMKRQAHLKPMEETSHFPNGTSAQHPPAHTIARGSLSPDNPVVTGKDHDAWVTQFPVPLTADLLARGQERFGIYCAPCHGADGYGEGIVVQRGFPHPPSFHQDRLRAAPVGHLFDVITRGYGVMYAYGDRVPTPDRWAIAAYVRALQRSQHATVADLPAEQRAQLSTP